MTRRNFKKIDLARRGFLHAAGGAGALGAIAVLMGKDLTVKTAPSVAAAEAAPDGGGYRETEHIRKYYRCARYW